MCEPFESEFDQEKLLTARIMTCSEQNATSCFSLPDNVTGSWCTQDSILSNQKLLDTICRANLSYQLHDFWVVEASISPNDQKATLRTLGNREEDTGDEGFAIVGLLEDGDLLSKT